MAKSFAWLNLSKWFSYINQDLDNVHNSADEIMEINDKKLETYLWEKISTWEMSDKDIDDYVKWLDNQKIRRINEKWTWFSTNWIISYLNHWNDWKNPFASWTWMYEKKPTPITETDTYQSLRPLIDVWWTLLFWEAWWATLQAIGNKIYENNVKPTKRDVQIKFIDESDKKIYQELEKDLKAKWKELEKAKANWASAEEISSLEKDYKRIQNNMGKHTPKNRQTTVEAANQQWFAWDDYDMAKQARTENTLNWYREVDPYIDRSTATFKKTDILDSISRDSFWVDDYKWSKDYEPVLKEMKEFASKEWDISLRELQEWRNKIQVSKKSIEWQEAKAIEQNIYDKLDRAIWDKISETLEKENPWKWLWEKVKLYWKTKEFQTSELWKATKELTKETEKADTLFRRIRKIPANIYDKIFSKKTQTKVAQWMQKIGKTIRPSTWLKWMKDVLVNIWAKPEVVDKAITTVAKWERITWMVLPKVLRRLVWLMWEVMLPLEWLATADFIDRHSNEYSVIPLLEEKIRWRNWNPSEDTAWWTEEDWEDMWLWSDDIYNIIYSDWFREIAEKWAWNWWDIIDRYVPLTEKNYSPILELWD